MLFCYSSCNSRPAITEGSGRDAGTGGNTQPAQASATGAGNSREVVTVFSTAERDPYSESLTSSSLPEKVELFYFYEQSCESCNEIEDFFKILSNQLPREVRDRYPHTIYTINTFSAEGRKTYEQVTDAMGLNRLQLQAPMLIAGGRVYQGRDTISANIQEAYLTAAEDIFVFGSFYNPALRKTGSRLFEDFSLKPNHVTMVYFYRTTCPSCEELSPFINALPGMVNTGGRQIPLNIIRINTRSGNNSDRVMAFFEKYRVPDIDRKVPIVFLEDSYLSGAESITGNLQAKLSAPASVNLLAELIHYQRN